MLKPKAEYLTEPTTAKFKLTKKQKANTSHAKTRLHFFLFSILLLFSWFVQLVRCLDHLEEVDSHVLPLV
jgi:hypothetical protein